MAVKKPVTVNPLKLSPALGASWAAQGFKKCMPLLHAAPGCTFLDKVLLTQHSREPIAITGTDIQEMNTIFGSSDDLEKKLTSFIEKSKPEFVPVIQTALPEVRGEDIEPVIDKLQQDYPDTVISLIIAADYQGSFSDGYANLVESIIKKTLETTKVNVEADKPVINVLAPSFFTAGDADAIKEILISLGFIANVLPDFTISADGSKGHYSQMSHDGTTAEKIHLATQAKFTFVLSHDMQSIADFLQEKYGVEAVDLSEHVYGLKSADALVSVLKDKFGPFFPEKIVHDRKRYVDALIDMHLTTGSAEVVVALETNHAYALLPLLNELGSKITVITPTPLKKAVTANVKLLTGDFEDLEGFYNKEGRKPDLLIANTHGRLLAQKWRIPLLRMGFPIFDHFGATLKNSFGYSGGMNLAFEIANHISDHHFMESAEYSAGFLEKINNNDEVEYESSVLQ